MVLYREIGLKIDSILCLMCDAAKVLTLVQNLVSSKAPKHITRRELIVREREADGSMVVTKIHTCNNLGDMFTKVLAYVQYNKQAPLVLNVLAKGATRAGVCTT